MTSDDRIGLATLSVLTASSFLLGFWVRRMEKRSHRWVQLPGTITASSETKKSIRYNEKEVLPVIEYEFEFQGRLIRSNHWRFGNYTEGSPNSAAAITSRYSVGASVTVFLNPKNPRKSVLEFHTSTLGRVCYASGCFFLVILLLAWASAHRS